MDILIVDDNQDNRMTIELLLEDIEGIRVEEAVDGQDAIHKCKERHYDLIFMDIMMPKIDGIEATRKIKRHRPSAMIIALSALYDEKSKHAMLQSGAEDYITKPVDAELFKQRVKNYMSIISMRLKPIHATKMLSLFSDTSYPMSIKFAINSEAELAFFWDYSLNNSDCKAHNVSDIVRIIYGIGLLILKTKRTFMITVEENNDYIYITQASLNPLSEVAIRNVLLKHCPNAVYILKDGILSFKLSKISKIVQENTTKSIDKQDKEILSKTHFENITAMEYAEMTAISFMDKIETLEAIEDDLDSSLIKFDKDRRVVNIKEISQLFLEYVEITQQLMEFEHLSYAITSLSKFLSNLESSEFEDKKTTNLITLLFSLVSDLNNWRVTIFIKQESNDIHYLDSSLLSSCLQIESMFQEEKIEENDDDLEFF